MPDPVNTVPPVVSGTTEVGSILTCTPGSWTNNPTTFGYQWKRETGVGTGIYGNISGAVAPTRSLTSADVGLRTECVVTATNLPISAFPETGDGLFGVFTNAASGTDSNSAAYVSKLMSSVSSFILTVQAYGVAAYPVDNSTPVRSITINQFVFGPQQNPAQLPIMPGALPAQGTDAHAVFLHTSSGCMWEMWKWSGTNTCGATNTEQWNTSKCGYPAGCGCRGSSFFLLAGAIWPEEIVRGHIDHALNVVLPAGAVRKAYCAPSTDSDGVGTATNQLPEGARLRLNAATPLGGLSTLEQIVGDALKTYGMIVTDKTGGTDMSLVCVAPQSWTARGLADPWAAAGYSGYPDLSGLLALLPANLIVCPTGPVTTSWSNIYHLSGCEI